MPFLFLDCWTFDKHTLYTITFFHFLYVQTSLVIDDTDIKQKTSNILCLGENVVDIHGTINSSIC